MSFLVRDSLSSLLSSRWWGRVESNQSFELSLAVRTDDEWGCRLEGFSSSGLVGGVLGWSSSTPSCRVWGVILVAVP